MIHSFKILTAVVSNCGWKVHNEPEGLGGPTQDLDFDCSNEGSLWNQDPCDSHHISHNVSGESSVICRIYNQRTLQ